MNLLPLAAVSTVLAACAAPPLGLGTGARLPTTTRGERANGFVAAGATSVGAAEDRRTFQADGSVGLVLRRWFTIEAGVVYTQLSEDGDGDGGLFAAGGFPYLRPRFQIGLVSVATALAGLGFGGGGGGIYGGIADVQVGYGTPAWSIYTGAYGTAFEATGGDSTTSASGSQLRLGGEYLMPVGAVKLGVAIEIYRQHDELRGDDRRVESTFVGAGLKLRLESGVFQ